MYIELIWILDFVRQNEQQRHQHELWELVTGIFHTYYRLNNYLSLKTAWLYLISLLFPINFLKLSWKEPDNLTQITGKGDKVLNLKKKK